MEHLVNRIAGSSKIPRRVLRDPECFVAWLIIIRLYDLVLETPFIENYYAEDDEEE